MSNLHTTDPRHWFDLLAADPSQSRDRAYAEGAERFRASTARHIDEAERLTRTYMHFAADYERASPQERKRLAAALEKTMADMATAAEARDRASRKLYDLWTDVVAIRGESSPIEAPSKRVRFNHE